MSSHESFAAWLSDPSESDRISDIQIIDLSDPSRRHEEHSFDEREKEDSLLSLAKMADSRTKYMQVLFEKGMETHDTTLATELIEECRYWMEDVEHELEFIQDYREETGQDEAFTKAAASLVETKKEINSHLEHMLATVRAWHEEEMRSNIPDRGSDESEGIFEDNADKGLITEGAPPAETMLNATNESASASSTSSEPTFLPKGYHEKTPEEIANEKTEEEAWDINPEEEEILAKQEERASSITETRSPAFEYQGTPEETRENYEKISKVIRHAEQDMEGYLTFNDRERFDDYLITLSHAYADFNDRLKVLNGYVLQSESVKKEKEILFDAMEKIQNVRKRIHALHFPEAPPFLVDIPSGIDETLEKCSAISRLVRQIEMDISRTPSAAVKAQLPEYLIALSREHTAFEERLDLLHQVPIQSAEVREEQALIGDALEKIQDARHHIRDIQFSIPADEQLDVQIELREEKKNKLERIAKRLADALERSGVEHPELYMTEQSSGLGTIRRGLMRMFGKKELVINKATLTKLRKEAIQAEENYFDLAYSLDETAMPFYQKAIERNPILRLNEQSDVHELWQALHQEIEELSGQLDGPLNRDTLEAPASAKVAVAETVAFRESRSGKALEKQRQEGQDLSEAFHSAEIERIESSGIEDATDIYHAIQHNPNAKHLTFQPEDYLSALADLKQANSTKDLAQIKKSLPRARSMKDELNGAWIDMTNEEGNSFSDEAILNRARILIGMEEEGGRKRKTKKAA
jgi:hypothetical protein